MSGIVSWFASVRGRITVGVTAVFTLAMVFGTWFLLDRAEAAWIEDLEAQDLAELDMIAQDLLAMQALESMLSDGVVLPVGEGGTSFELTDESGALVGATPLGAFGGFVISGPVSSDEIPDEFLEGSFGTFEILGDVTSVSLPVEVTGGTLTLTASSSLEPVRAGLGALRGILLLVVPFLVTGVGVMAWIVTGRAFRPVEDITNQVERLTDDRLDERIPVPDSRDEVAHLAGTMNKMLDRLSSSRRRQREFVSDASHELRNPIATSRTKLEVALANPEHADWEDTAEVVLQEQERLGSLVDSLLELARLDEQGIAEVRDVDLDDLVFAEVKRLSSLIDISVDGVQPVRVRGDAHQLTHAVRNLIDNATQHAHSKMAVALCTDGDDAVLSIDDDGEGIPEDKRAAVFERFVRLDESRMRGAGGAGLGLGLVAAVVTAHGGSVVATESGMGGAKLEVRLPTGSSS